MAEVSMSSSLSELPMWRLENAAGLVDESLMSIIASHDCFRVMAGALAEWQTRHPHGVRHGQGGFVDATSEICHVMGTRDLHSRDSSLKSPKSGIHWDPELAMIAIVAPIRLEACHEDVVELRTEFVAAIENRCEGDPAFVPQPVADIDGLLVEHLLAAGSRLDESTPEGASECAGNSKASGPYGSVPLIHGAHHAWTEAAHADA